MPVTAPHSWNNLTNKPNTVSGFGISDMASQTVANATNEKCKAWVNFNGTGTVAIRASGNVSSITDNGTGDYTVNFTAALPDASYAANYSNRILDNATTASFDYSSVSAVSASAVRVWSYNNAGSLTDSARNNVAIFR